MDKIPTEIWFHIFRLIAGSSSVRPRGVSLLVALSRTCSFFHDIANSIIYEEMDWRSPIFYPAVSGLRSKEQTVIDSLKENPARRTAVRRCYVGNIGNGRSDMLLHLNGLQELDCTSWACPMSLKDLLSHYPNLKSLGLAGCSFRAGPPPLLSNLQLQKLHLDGNSLSAQEELVVLTHTPSLQTLSVEGGITDPVFRSHLVRRSPLGLQTLELRLLNPAQTGLLFQFLDHCCPQLDSISLFKCNFGDSVLPRTAIPRLTRYAGSAHDPLMFLSGRQVRSVILYHPFGEDKAPEDTAIYKTNPMTILAPGNIKLLAKLGEIADKCPQPRRLHCILTRWEPGVVGEISRFFPTLQHLRVTCDTGCPTPVPGHCLDVLLPRFPKLQSLVLRGYRASSLLLATEQDFLDHILEWTAGCPDLWDMTLEGCGTLKRLHRSEWSTVKRT